MEIAHRLEPSRPVSRSYLRTVQISTTIGELEPRSGRRAKAAPPFRSLIAFDFHLHSPQFIGEGRRLCNIPDFRCAFSWVWR